MKKILLGLIVSVLLLTGCGSDTNVDTGYKEVSVDKAYSELYEEESIYIILDVRTSEEYDEGHLKGAINIPYDEIETQFNEQYKTINIMVYCQSGARAKTAANTLVKMGYINVYTFGGLNDWTYSDVIEK